MRVVGIDPGTLSIDLCGLADGQLFIDATVPTGEALADPASFVARLSAAGPLDLVVGPSGYGMAVTRGDQLTDESLRLALLTAPGEPGGIGGMGTLIRALARSTMPVVFTPGAVHLPTVPRYRKIASTSAPPTKCVRPLWRSLSRPAVADARSGTSR